MFVYQRVLQMMIFRLIVWKKRITCAVDPCRTARFAPHGFSNGAKSPAQWHWIENQSSVFPFENPVQRLLQMEFSWPSEKSQVTRDVQSLVLMVIHDIHDYLGWFGATSKLGNLHDAISKKVMLEYPLDFAAPKRYPILWWTKIGGTWHLQNSPQLGWLFTPQHVFIFHFRLSSRWYQHL